MGSSAANADEPGAFARARESARAALADFPVGLTVALVGLPQCLAYAALSGLPPVYGLVTATVPAAVAAVLGGSTRIVTGPTNTTGVLIMTALLPVLGSHGQITPEALNVVATLAALVAILRLVGARFGLVSLLGFFPESVLAMFVAVAGLLIAVLHLDEALGFAAARSATSFGALYNLGSALLQGARPSIPAMFLAAGTMLVVVLGRRVRPSFPWTACIVIGAATAAKYFGLDAARGVPLTRDWAPIPDHWPAIGMPTDWASIPALLPIGCAITIAGTLELMATARAANERLDLQREIKSQGWANLAGSFTGAFPASTSLTRSAVLRWCRPRSRWGALHAAAITGLVLLGGGEIVGFIPQASLAGILLVTAFNMIDVPLLRRLWRTAPETRFLLVITGLLGLLWRLEFAILAGAAIALVLHLRRTSQPRITLLTPAGDRLVPVEPGSECSTVVVEVSGDLHYAAIPSFADGIRASVPRTARLVVCDLTHAHEPRFAAVRALEELGEELAERGAQLRLCGVSDRFAACLRGANLKIPITGAVPEPGGSIWRCLRDSEAEGGPVRKSDYRRIA